MEVVTTSGEPVFKEITLESIQALLSFMKTQINQLSDGDDRKLFSEALKHLETAMEMATDNKRKTCLYDAATKFTNQLAFRLFIEDKLKDSVLEEFQSFESIRTVEGYAQAYTDFDRETADNITKLQQKFMDERRPFEVFQAVINGMSKEEAEQKQAEFLERQKEALQR